MESFAFMSADRFTRHYKLVPSPALHICIAGRLRLQELSITLGKRKLCVYTYYMSTPPTPEQHEVICTMRGSGACHAIGTIGRNENYHSLLLRCKHIHEQLASAEIALV
ncbi:hypothetical protein HRR83_007564 [Exophiala dermatitidis]|uniref:Uncharacterized protein n=1 Tax=Exophiala dermatitidis TaxID=5970 RepID=A0AAN6IVG4_EXODE|nr:hypothetical protein HRR74_007199 [Exophiala dermatitidis]KAJ4521702.1 hypothetical protein HRR73_002900 [Exophiala dermatitidis]KAJ4539392.1 hypothetical protein HRR77_006280 [Exophiala dermatitidis]KAJ4548530.1 hypothetical protein HRR76_001124 [Exophiala dermatitidis]KAJ4562813.1 hypothetical protein HRR79_006413 [Exophiala dermatitidis]